MIPVVEKPEVVAQKEKLLKDLGTAYVVLLHLPFFMFNFNECCKKCDSKGEAKLFKGSIKKHKQSCPHNCHYDDSTIQYGTEKQAHENVLRQINQKELPDFIDSADTITLQDLDDDFTAAEVDSMIAELSKWDFESWNAVEQHCS